MRAAPRGKHGRLRSVGRRILCCALCRCASSPLAVTPESPEVKKLVDAGLEYLSKERRRAARRQVPDRPGVSQRPSGATIRGFRKPSTACREAMTANPADASSTSTATAWPSSFCASCRRKQYAKEIEWFLEPHEEAAKAPRRLGLRHVPDRRHVANAIRRAVLLGGPPPRLQHRPASVENLADWLMRTQDPDGCWGYQGEVAPAGGTLDSANRNELLDARRRLGSSYICADLLREPRPRRSRRKPRPQEPATAGLPPALRPVVAQADQPRRLQQMRPQRTDASKLLATIGPRTRLDGQELRDRHRHQSATTTCTAWSATRAFRKCSKASRRTNPKWYNDGYEFLAKDQAPDGSWTGYCGPSATRHSRLCSCCARRRRAFARAGRRHAAAAAACPATCRGPSCATARSSSSRSTPKSMSCCR